MDDSRNFDCDYWRSRAQEARLTAELLLDPEAREHLLCAAMSFERIAQLAAHGPDSAGQLI